MKRASAGGAGIGPFIDGAMAAWGLSRKQVAVRYGTNENYLSKLLTGFRPVSDRQAFRLGVAAGEIRAELRWKAAH